MTFFGSQFGNRVKIDSHYHQPTCKGGMVAMPGVVFDSGFGQCFGSPVLVIELCVLSGVLIMVWGPGPIAALQRTFF